MMGRETEAAKAETERGTHAHKHRHTDSHRLTLCTQNRAHKMPTQAPKRLTGFGNLADQHRRHVLQLAHQLPHPRRKAAQPAPAPVSGMSGTRTVWPATPRIGNKQLAGELRASWEHAAC